VAALHGAVHGDLLARAHEHDVAHDRTDSIGDILLGPSDDARGARLEPISRVMAALVRPVARDSRYLPSRISTTMTAAASK
jgi:hypothetical protein